MKPKRLPTRRGEAIARRIVQDVRDALRDTGMTQTALGERLGGDRRLVSNQLMRGNVTLKTLTRWCDVLGMDLRLVRRRASTSRLTHS